MTPSFPKQIRHKKLTVERETGEHRVLVSAMEIRVDDRSRECCDGASRLEALPVDDGRSGLIVFLFADPHGLEGGQGSQDGATDPDGVFALRRGNDLNLHGRRGHGRDLLLHTVSNTREHGRATGHDGVGVQVLTDINIALHDGVEGGLVDTARFHTQEGWLEQGLWATETLVANGDDLYRATTTHFLNKISNIGHGAISE